MGSFSYKRNYEIPRSRKWNGELGGPKFLPRKKVCLRGGVVCVCVGGCGWVCVCVCEK